METIEPPEPKPSRYWAAKPLEELAKQLVRRRDAYYQHLESSGRLNLWRLAHREFHRGYHDGGQLKEAGSAGQLLQASVNNVRNLGTHITSMTTSSPPAFDSRPRNTDVTSQAMATLNNGLLDNDLREKQLREKLVSAVDFNFLAGEAWMCVDWDPHTGEVVAQDPMSGAPRRGGDTRYATYHPLDVIRDYTRTSPTGHRWNTIRTWENKWDLCERWPQYADQIEAMKCDPRDSTSPRLVPYTDQDDSDEIAVYHWFHDRTDALPDGRYAIFLSADCLPFDGPLPYGRIPLYRMAGGEHIGTCFGYSLIFDLLALQRAHSGLVSTVVTNQNLFGVANIAVAQGSGLKVTQLPGGAKVLHYKPGLPEPKALSLLNTSGEVFKMMDLIERYMETLSGVNSVARGNPEASLKSGAALALVQSQALAFSSGTEASYSQLIQDVGTGATKIREAFVTSERLSHVVGKAGGTLAKRWTGQQLGGIDRVVVDRANALARTSAGRLELAQQLIAIPDPAMRELFIQVVTTGKIEPITEGAQNAALQARSENEAILEGTSVPVLVTDNHPEHIRSVLGLLASPDARSDAGLVERVLGHAQEHVGMWRTADPAILAALGIPPPPMLPLAGMPMDGTLPPEPGSPTETPPPAPGSASDTMLPPNNVADLPGMPSAPKNPLTGQPAPMPTPS